MISGYLLRDVINKVNGIHFLAKEEMFTLGHLYESMLKEMRDAAGQNRRVLHAARRWCGSWSRYWTRGSARRCSTPPAAPAASLVEAYAHLEKQCKTVQDRKMLQERSFSAARPNPCRTCSAR